MPMLKTLHFAAILITFAYPTLAQEHTHPVTSGMMAQSSPSPQLAQAPQGSPIPAAPAMGDMHAPTSFTPRSGIAEGRMVYIGVAGEIAGKVNPMLMVHEGETVQINLINGEGAEHDIVVEQYATRGASSAVSFPADCHFPLIRSASSSTSVRSRAIAQPAWRGASK
jgi:nitrite reductase (NO-forming)